MRGVLSHTDFRLVCEEEAEFLSFTAEKTGLPGDR